MTQGKFTLIDEEDSERVSRHFWYYASAGKGYAHTKIDGREVKLHHFIYGPREHEIDHINRHSLDNRRVNLREATREENAKNRTISSNNTSGFKGVHRNRHGKWVARIRRYGERLYLGSFITTEDAARAYDAAAMTYHGDFAVLNFPNETPDCAWLSELEERRREGARVDSLSGLVGVSQRKNGKWTSRVTINGETTRFGVFDTPEEAMDARKRFLVRKGK